MTNYLKILMQTLVWAEKQSQSLGRCEVRGPKRLELWFVKIPQKRITLAQRCAWFDSRPWIGRSWTAPSASSRLVSHPMNQ